jgi:hypothetical protein
VLLAIGFLCKGATLLLRKARAPAGT